MPLSTNGDESVAHKTRSTFLHAVCAHEHQHVKVFTQVVVFLHMLPSYTVKRKCVQIVLPRTDWLTSGLKHMRHTKIRLLRHFGIAPLSATRLVSAQRK